MNKAELNDPAQIAEVEAQLRDMHVIAEPARVILGNHPQHGFVVLIKTSAGAVMLADGVPSARQRTDPGPYSVQVSGR